MRKTIIAHKFREGEEAVTFRGERVIIHKARGGKQFRLHYDVKFDDGNVGKCFQEHEVRAVRRKR